MANEAINRPLGGTIGELAKLGIDVVPDYANPSQSTVEFSSPVTIAEGGELRLEGTAKLETETGAVTLSSNAGTLSKLSGKITSESLTTAAGSSVTFTITNTLVATADIIMVTRNGGTSTNGTPTYNVVPGDGSFTIVLTNRHASAAFNGTFIFSFLLIKQAA